MYKKNYEIALILWGFSLTLLSKKCIGRLCNVIHNILKIIENVDIIDGVKIKTHIDRYDLKTDFKNKNNQEDDNED